MLVLGVIIPAAVAPCQCDVTYRTYIVWVLSKNYILVSNHKCQENPNRFHKATETWNILKIFGPFLFSPFGVPVQNTISTQWHYTGLGLIIIQHLFLLQCHHVLTLTQIAAVQSTTAHYFSSLTWRKKHAKMLLMHRIYFRYIKILVKVIYFLINYIIAGVICLSKQYNEIGTTYHPSTKTRVHPYCNKDQQMLTNIWCYKKGILIN